MYCSNFAEKIKSTRDPTKAKAGRGEKGTEKGNAVLGRVVVSETISWTVQLLRA